MHVNFSYQHVSRNPQLERTINLHTRKLEKFLSRFSPDLIQLHGVLEYSAAHQGPVCSLNLWLPTAQLHSREEGGTALTALQRCFNQLVEQVKKHKQVLRREGVWKRRRYKFQQEVRELEASELRVKDRQQLRDYLDQVLPQLERFVARELRYREMGGGLLPGQAQKEEIVNEVVARALENVKTNSSHAVPFHLLISEAIHVLNGPLAQPVTASPGDSTGTVSPGESAGSPAGKIGAAHLWRHSHEPVMDIDIKIAHPPEPVDLLLVSLPTLNRQVYVLHALEGFSWEETAQVLGKTPNEVAEMFRRVSQAVSATLHES